MSNSRSFFNEHFGATITAVVSLSAVLVSLAQVWVADINKEKELQITKSNAEEARKLDELKSSRAWKLDLAKFMATHRKEIFAENEESLHLQKIMLVTFPREITANVFGNLSRIDSKENSFWEKAESSARQLQEPRVKLYYEKSFPEEIMSVIGDTLAEGWIEYNYSDQLIPEGLTLGDVRYFHEDDRELAIQARKEFVEQSCYEGYKIDLKLIPLVNSKLRAPKGTVEIWLSGKSVISKTNSDEC